MSLSEKLNRLKSRQEKAEEEKIEANKKRVKAEKQKSKVEGIKQKRIREQLERLESIAEAKLVPIFEELNKQWLEEKGTISLATTDLHQYTEFDHLPEVKVSLVWDLEEWGDEERGHCLGKHIEINLNTNLEARLQSKFSNEPFGTFITGKPYPRYETKFVDNAPFAGKRSERKKKPKPPIITDVFLRENGWQEKIENGIIKILETPREVIFSRSWPPTPPEEPAIW